ncbi:hypothetical protein LINPERHAP2_LOCUS31143 [Linum perenne]
MFAAAIPLSCSDHRLSLSRSSRRPSSPLPLPLPSPLPPSWTSDQAVGRHLPIPASSEAEDIRKAVVLAAEMFRVRTTWEYSGFEQQKDDAEDGLLFDWDEEASFELPGLIGGLAEGLLIPPPVGYAEEDCCFEDLQIESKIEGQPLPERGSRSISFISQG